MTCHIRRFHRDLRRALLREDGATTAEYAITVLATNYWLGHT